MSDPTNVLLVAGGKWHDIDYARLELLKHLGADENLRTTVREDFSDLEALRAADFLVTYTCDIEVEESEEKALAEFVQSGRRWLALHGSNAVMEFLDDGQVACPRKNQLLMKTLGSQFIAHPPIQPYTVTVSQPDHPLVAGVEPFEVRDELYLCEYHGEIDVLLETRFTGEALGFQESTWEKDEPRPVMYLHPEGEGEVLYLTLGHCRGPWDMRPMIPHYPQTERGSWESPIYHELLRRSLRWAKSGLAGV